MLGILPSGARGFDCNVVVAFADALRFRSRGYSFAIRYVRRAPSHDYDLTQIELAGLLRAGLAVGVVQHVAPPGWHPSATLGLRYGETAADEAGYAGVEPGCTLWCDLEEVARGTPAADVIGYCNAWHDAVKAGGFDPGLYVGYGAGLSAHDLYWRLRMKRFWAAYNLDRPNYPAVRGAQLRQFAATSADLVPGIRYEFDVNLAGKDAKGGSPVFMLPPASAAVLA